MRYRETGTTMDECSPERLLPSCYRCFHCSTDPPHCFHFDFTLRISRHGTRNIVFLLVLFLVFFSSLRLSSSSQMLFLSRHFLFESVACLELSLDYMNSYRRTIAMCFFEKEEDRSFKTAKKKEPTTELFSLIFSPKLNTIDVR